MDYTDLRLRALFCWVALGVLTVTPLIPNLLLTPPPSPPPQVLLRARAVENQCYVVAAAQTGSHNQCRASYGHSMVVDPWGAVVAQCRDGPGVCYAEIDLPYLHRVRREMPVRGHRRADLYGAAGRKTPELREAESEVS